MLLSTAHINNFGYSIAHASPSQEILYNCRQKIFRPTIREQGSGLQFPEPLNSVHCRQPEDLYFHGGHAIYRKENHEYHTMCRGLVSVSAITDNFILSQRNLHIQILVDCFGRW